ncbi:MAG: hypothetical protein ACE37H_13865 [Phycisphaeraceae bacterium]
MNEQELEEIEARLAAMRPAEPGPALRQRVARSVADQQGDRPVLARPWWRKPLAGALAVAAAVGLAGLVVWLAVREPGAASVAEEQEAPVIEMVRAAPQPPPTLLDLNRAWNESPDALDAMLTRSAPGHGAPTPREHKPLPTVADSRRWDFQKDLP